MAHGEPVPRRGAAGPGGGGGERAQAPAAESLDERALRLAAPPPGAAAPPGSVPRPRAPLQPVAAAPRPSRATPPVPRWIWSDAPARDGQRVWFRRGVRLEGGRAVLRVTADNHAIVRVEGTLAGRVDDWAQPAEIDLAPWSPSAAATIEIEAWNDGGPAGLALLIESGAGFVASDASWEVAGNAGFDGKAPARDLGPMGMGPWGALPLLGEADIDRSLAVVAGFTVESVYSVPRAQGSWVSLAVDDRGRLLAGAEGGGVYRLTPGSAGAPPGDAVVEPIDLPIGGPQGLLCVGRDLFCAVNVGGAEGPGLYRARDVDGDDDYDELVLVRRVGGGAGEHGLHGLALGRDGMLYVVAGNHVPLPDPEGSVVPRAWGEDLLLPRLWDPGGHAVGIMAPGGWICRTDPTGGPWELFSIGFRNPYDIAFDRRGELFTYDADMEWDMGAPWYRPTRICHVTSGSEFGWRSGSGKWPPHYPDSLPATLDIGPGSPTGVLFGHGSSFPAPYRDALFALDWTFGTIHAVHLSPHGSSFQATHEPFLTGTPLPVTDAVVNPADGAMYVALGGRGMSSAVYRVRWSGAPAAEGGDAERDLEARPVDGAHLLRALRQRLESFHRADAPAAALEEIWPALRSGDRFVRFAARVALEHQPVERWAERIEREPDARARLAALLVLARVGGSLWREHLVRGLREIDWDGIDLESRRELLRVWSLAFIRSGPPDASLARALLQILEPRFPSGDELLDRDLCDLLVFLESPAVVGRAVALMERPDEVGAAQALDTELLGRSQSYGQVILAMMSAPPQRQQVHYALSLRGARRGWTPELRRRYFAWFDRAARAQGGLSFAGFLRAIRAEAVAALPEAERERFAAGAAPAAAHPAGIPRGPGRAWTVADVVALAEDGLTHRDFQRGRQLYTAALCAHCHRFAGTGGSSGPDLTGASRRFALRDLVATILEPSAVVSDQYRNLEVELDDATVHVGRVVHQDQRALRLQPTPLVPDALVEIPLERVRRQRPSPLSPMPPFLLDGMAPGEVQDVLAYLLSEGDPRAGFFTPSGAAEFTSIFDGVSLAGWRGDQARWTVEGAAIVGRNPGDLARNTFLVLEAELPDDFELRAEVQLRGDNNSGIQYRSVAAEDHSVRGYQCDIHPRPEYHGMLYEEGGRGIVARQGERIQLDRGGGRAALAEARAAIDFKPGDWHEYAVIACGRRLEHRVDGTSTVVVVDETGGAVPGRTVALQLHAGAAYEVRFRNLRVRALGPAP